MGNAKESILFEPFYVLVESFIGEGIFFYLLLIYPTLNTWSQRLHVYSSNRGNECAIAFVANGVLASGALADGDNGNLSTGDRMVHNTTAAVARGSSDCGVYSPNCDGEYDSTFASDSALAGGKNGGVFRTET